MSNVTEEVLDTAIDSIAFTPILQASAERNPLHRIAEVRQQEGISERSAARRMGIPVEQMRCEEAPTTDLLLSQLTRWQQMLEVPVGDLLMEQSDNSHLSAPINTRARLIRIMKTVRAIEELARTSGVTRLSERLAEQLLELMPELRDVAAWHTVGHRRSRDEMGRVADRILPSNVFERYDS